ncbi:hypothetical protein [Mumia sp. DW29H23]|uniref:hypothetical protein n=1 Tax=Mumia sp. DW29H23 TaxID=3421241 RepID=UPI003D681FA6
MDLSGLWWVALAVGRSAVDQAAWMDRLAVLDEARSAAFVRKDASLLDDVYVPGARERAADADLLARYASRGLELESVRFTLLRFRVERRTAGRVVLRVVDRLEPVRVRQHGGAWREMPRDGATERRIVVHDTAAGWRIGSVQRLAG